MSYPNAAALARNLTTYFVRRREYYGRALFSAYNSVTDANVTGDGTTHTVICDTEIEDRNGDYNNATGVLTAPVDGHYLLIYQVRLDQYTAGFGRLIATLNTSNRSYYYRAGPTAAMDDILVVNVATIADMDAADTAQVDVQVTGGAKTIDVYGGSIYTFFQGYLLI